MRRRTWVIAILVLGSACTDATTTTTSMSVPVTTTSVTAASSTTSTTLPLPTADPYCRDGKPRLIAALVATRSGDSFLEEVAIVDLPSRSAIGSIVAPLLSQRLTTAVALPDGSALVATGPERSDPGGVHLLTNTEVIPVLKNSGPSAREVLDEQVTIVGFRCDETGFFIDVVFGDLEAELASFRGLHEAPEILEPLWTARGDLVGSTERSPDGRFVAVTAWPVDPVYGPILRVLDATTGEDVPLPINLGPTFDGDEILLDSPIGLNWLPDGRLLFFFSVTGGADRPDAVAVDLGSGSVEPWDLDPYLDPTSCRYGDVLAESVGSALIFTEGDSATTLPFEADFVRATC